MLYDGVQVSMRATIVKIKADNWILTFCRPVDVSNIRLQIHTGSRREVTSVDALVENALYVPMGVRWK